MLTLLLNITSSALLARTGLGEVFQDAVMPCLLYLPSLTPEDQSIELLTQAYPALITLGRVRYPSKEADFQSKMKFLDQVFRKGVLGGYAHCSEKNVHVSRCLVDQMAIFIHEMGIWSVKHLKVSFSPHNPPPLFPPTQPKI